MTKITIHPGPCKLITTVEAEKVDRKTAKVSIKTDCSFYKPLETELTEVDANKEIFGSALGKGDVYEMCAKYAKHPTCPVPCGILKAVEAACGFALPTDVEIIFEK